MLSLEFRPLELDSRVVECDLNTGSKICAPQASAIPNLYTSRAHNSGDGKMVCVSSMLR